MPLDAPPVHLMVAPMTHAAGVCSFPMLPFGGTNIFMGTADPGGILAAIEKHRVTHIYMPPTLIYMLLSYCLLVAYLAKSSDILDVFAGHTLPPAVSAGVLCASTAALFLVGGPPAADRMNQALTSALLLLFVFILTKAFENVFFESLV